MNAPEPRSTDLAEREALLALYRTMLRIRRFDERVTELFNEGAIKGTAHSCVGQEAVAAGACAALRPSDAIVSHHRGHGHCLAKGADMRRMMAELMGRIDGYCRGLGGSMHIADLALNILGANGIVGAGIGIGTGAALAAQLRGGDDVVLVFFGDGAANEGIFHEALNIASLWNLPVIYVCENNQFALSTRMDQSTACDTLAERAAAYRMPGVRVDGNDAQAVQASVAQAVERARAGAGPSLIEALTWRVGDHSMRANLPRYRTAEEESQWQARDALARMEERLHRAGCEAMLLQQVAVEVEAELKAAEAFARASREPLLADLADAVTAPHRSVPEPLADTPRELDYAAAIREALEQAMAEDERVFLIGEDVAKIGGIFGASRGLLARFGPERVRDTPISEQGIAACAVGAAISGCRPVVEIQIFDFVTLMMDMIVNQAAKLRFMLGGKATVPIVFRGPQGGGIRLAAQHSQCLESWFMHVPGLVVLAPSSPFEAKGLLMAAIRDDNPVVFLEHKLLYVRGKSRVPEAPYEIPIGRAAIRRHGEHCTVVATLAMVDKALAAARTLEREGISIEVIDPRTLRPLDVPAIIASVKRTSRLVIAHEGWKSAGFGAEVAALTAEYALDWLDAPIVRIGSLDMPMPYNDKLEQAVMPSQQQIEAAVRALVHRDTRTTPYE